MSETKIYLDNAATTRISDNVIEAMMPWLREGYGNASSLYSLGRKSAIALNRSRAACAEAIGCESREVFFTSGGTESDNTAVFSAAQEARKSGKRHFITSAIEHPAILEPLKKLEKEGFRITKLPVHENGIVRPEELEAAITQETSFVTVMAANNEIGTLQPIGDIGRICHEHGILFHTDAVQAVGSIPVDVRGMNIDMLSVSGHKLHAMKGTGFLYVSERVPFYPFLLGGHQQGGRRAGTENIAGIVGLAEAMRYAAENLESRRSKLSPLRERLIAAISAMSGTTFNGDREKSLPSIVNFSFAGVEGETLVLQLDLLGIAVSSGSACASGSTEPSHVIAALGGSADAARGSIRISMSDETSESDVEAVISALGKVSCLRSVQAAPARTYDPR